jgi:hypothetical protein
MIGYLREIGERRRMLLARAIAERAALAAAAQPLAQTLHATDRIARYARSALTVMTAVSLARRLARWASASR